MVKELSDESPMDEKELTLHNSKVLNAYLSSSFIKDIRPQEVRHYFGRMIRRIFSISS